MLERLGIPTPGPDHDPRDAVELVAQRLLMLTRAGLTPVLVVAGAVAGGLSAWFWAILGARVAWQAFGLVFTFSRHWRRYPERWGPLVDLAGLSCLIAASGGASSPLRWVVLGLPVLSGFLWSARRAALVTATLVVAYLAPALPDALAGEPRAGVRIAATLVGIAMSGAAGVCLAYGRERLTARAAATDAGRRRLMTAGLDAEDSERRRVSQELHGEALQVLLAAAQDLEEGADDHEALRRSREGVRSGVALLRDTVRDLHPAAVRHVGLEAALLTALEHRLRGVVLVEVLPGADRAREAMLLSVVREVGDALATLAPDSAVAARVSRGGSAVRLAVSADGGEGGAPAHLAALARCRERVDADGGSLDVREGPDRRVVITIQLPLDPEAVSPRGEAVAERAATRRIGQQFLAALQLLATVAVWVDALVAGRPGTVFLVAAGLGTVIQLAGVALAFSTAWRRYPTDLAGIVGVLAFGALVALQGGITTELPGLAVIIPFCLVLSFRPRRGLALSCALAAGLVLPALPGAIRDEAGAREAVVVVLAALAWATAAATLLGACRERMRRRLVSLEHARRRLLHDSLDAADAERRRLSERLHDGALQALMIAGQDLDEALAGEPGALARAEDELREGLQLLRDTVAELHPPALEHGGLRPAVAAVVERSRQRAHFAVRVDVDPRADGLLDGLLVALVRELVVNVAKHADARTVGVTIALMGGDVILEVADDGIGIDPERRASAMATGHIGLASARERVQAEGGSMEVATGLGAGTRVRIVVPAPVGALS